MSHVIDDSSGSTGFPQSNPVSGAPPNSAAPSWVESFVQNFFQEKNIKWMLIVGAAIVFGSSLMLVNKAWPEWSPALKYLTIVGYTGVFFCAAELSRRRLKLPATGVVLQSLTMLLLPVCFLSLTWLSAGTAVQEGLHLVPYLGLLIPAVALLYFASTSILDHWLRGRQTTFLVSFGLLCVAGALPVITSPIIGLTLLAVCWGVFTAGVVKVNRHTFWLAEQHQLPRIFGFLPIAMLGIQFVVLVGTKAAAVLPAQWIGLAVVMVSATILMTARTVADVFRQRTGDLVRPLPWPIIVPLFGGLVLAVLGLGLSMVGFSYVGETTYAVIPASIVVAVLLSLVARDTRHPGFVWAALVVGALAYQCSPTLFADLVQAARSATADAINQSRVPISMYGLTYLPLLGVLAVVGRRFARRGLLEFSRPIKHFVTALSIGLFAVALADAVMLKFISPFLVSVANSVAFVAYAILFRDRRYVLPATVAFVVACATAIPALNQMQYTQLPLAWVPVVIAGVALLLNAATFLDGLANRIPVSANDRLSKDAHGRDRRMLQLTGCSLAVAVGFHWIVSTAMAFDQPLSLPMMLQFALLMFALVRFTLGTAHYLSAASVWLFGGYAALRWVAGLEIPAEAIVSYGTLWLIATSLFSFAIVKGLRARLNVDSLAALRQSLGFNVARIEPTAAVENSHRYSQKLAAFALPLFDLSTIALSFLVAAIHIPAVIIQHAGLFDVQVSQFVGFGWSTPAVLIWLFALAWANRNQAFGFIAAMLMPLVVSSILITSGTLTTLTGLLLVWAVVQSAMTIVCHWLSGKRDDVPGLSTMLHVSQAWSFGLLGISCLSFDLPMRLLAAISVLSLGVSLWGRFGRRQPCVLAILANINLLLIAAAVGGCSGWLIPGWTGMLSPQALPFVFIVGCTSILVFEKPPRWIAGYEATQWAMALRLGMIPLMISAFMVNQFALLPLLAMTLGFVALISAELLKAFESRRELRVWSACLVAAVTALFLWSQEVISFGVGISQFVMLTLSVVGLTIAHLSKRDLRFAMFTRPMQIIGHSFPAIVACLALFREFSGVFSSLTALNALSLMIAAGIYFHQSAVLRRPSLSVAALAIANAGVFLLWRSLSWSSPELYLVPVGISVLGFAELMKKELPKAAHGPLHYIGLLTVLCSPVPEVLGGSWIHIFALMILSVVVILAAIGLRIRSLVYAGSAFLMADLVAMVIRSTIHNVDLLWICGVVLGIGVIVLAAFCENHREKLLGRIRMLSAELATWN
ncbi:MAG: hypothetical protein WBD20_02355 [Pirellulaceae bacterium]